MSLFRDKEQRDALMTRLAFFGVTKIVVRFSGSGDSGQIDGVEFEGCTPKHRELLQQDAIPCGMVAKKHVDGKWIEEASTQLMKIPKIIEELCNAASEAANIDWWNSDGGQGHFTIDLQDLWQGHPNITFFVEENVTQTIPHSFDYSEGIEDGRPPTEQD